MRNPEKTLVPMLRRIFQGLLATGLICSQAYASHDAAHGPGPGLEGAVPAIGSDAVPTVMQPPARAAKGTKRANFEQTQASKDARHVAHWVVDSGDNLNKPFVIIDKRDARVFVFDANGMLRGESPALLGLAIGDHSVPGIGTKKLSAIRPEERTTRQAGSLPTWTKTSRAMKFSGSTTTRPSPCTVSSPAIPRSAAPRGWPVRRRQSDGFRMAVSIFP